MIIQPTSLGALTWLGAASGASHEGWRIGTVLAARLLGLNPQGLMVLQIGATMVEAELPGGQLPPQFQVRVLSLGAQPLLEVLDAGPVGEPPLQQALRERLPQQDGYSPLLATFGALAQWPVLKQLPPSLRGALALLEHAMPSPQELGSGDGLRQAIARSGLFWETQLAHHDGDASALGQTDWKAALLRLAALLRQQPAPPRDSAAAAMPPLQGRPLEPQARQMPPTAWLDGQSAEELLPRLRGDVQAALARLEVAQLDASRAPGWLIELPVRGRDGADVLQLRLEHESSPRTIPTEVGESQWTLGFALDLPALGPLQGELQLRGLRLSIRLWALHPATTARLELQFDALRARLAANGVTLDQLHCQTGLPPSEPGRSAIFLKTHA